MSKQGIKNKSKTKKVMETVEIQYNAIEKETEKAMLIEAPVSWAGNMHTKSFWFPKSVIVEIENARCMKVKTWFIDKLSEQKAFNGYRMYFEEFGRK